METNSRIPVVKKKRPQHSKHKVDWLYAWDQQAFNITFFAGDHYHNYKTVEKLNVKIAEVSTSYIKHRKSYMKAKV